MPPRSTNPFARAYRALADFNVETLFSRAPPPAVPRNVYVNQELPRDMFDAKGKIIKSNKYSTNQVVTSKYTILTFAPRNLLEQFRRIANMFFLAIAILQFFPRFSTISPGLVLLPLIVVLAITAAKDGYEDIKRHQSDRQVNHSIVHVLRSGSHTNHNVMRSKEKTFVPGISLPKFVRRGKAKDPNATAVSTPASVNLEKGSPESMQMSVLSPNNDPDDLPPPEDNPGAPHWEPTLWEDVRVGDFVKLHDRESFPADIVICATSEEENVAYVETKNLDGETNLKSRHAVPELTHLRTAQDCAQAAPMQIEAEAPDVNMYRLNAAVVTESGKKSPIDLQTVFLRGTVLRNTRWATGVVLYAGIDSKIVLNSGGTPSKRGKVERQMNPQVFINLIILAIMAVVCAIVDSTLEKRAYKEGAYWMAFATQKDDNPNINGLVTFANALITFQNVIPISLYISIEFVRTCQAAFIYFDREIYYAKNDTPTLARSWNLSDDLGQIEYVFSDKTGTLTQNNMVFRQCSVGGTIYKGEELPEEAETEAEENPAVKQSPSSETTAIDEDPEAGITPKVRGSHESTPGSSTSTSAPQVTEQPNVPPQAVTRFVNSQLKQDIESPRHVCTPSPSVPSPTARVSSIIAGRQRGRVRFLLRLHLLHLPPRPAVPSPPIRRCGPPPNPRPIPMATPRAAPPVTGDRYLDLLVRFVGRNAGALLDGSVTLRLHPVGLHYVASRLEALRELEAVGAGAPVDYLRAYVADLGDHRALEQLRRILRLLTSLKVVAAGPGRDPAPLSLLPFAHLRVLELRGCDLSTSAARGLLDLRHTLERLVCYNSTDALRHVFTSRIMDIKDSPVWSRLSYVSCASNGLVLMDESLQLLPAVETLDLSRNRFAKLDNVRKCTKLRNLDLGFNHLRSISSLSEVCSRIVKLVLRNNALTTVHGIENLKSLAGLDLSYNIISNFSELEILGSLSLLQNLWLEGNPICCARWYRAHVFSFFHNSENLKLDDKGMNTQEYWEKQVLFASRQKQPAGYGFYFPAKDDHEDEDTSNSKMRRISRLACIVEEERSLCDEGVDQQSTPHDSDNSKKDEVAAADSDIKITSLINTAELMKKERSTDWLREFKNWMDENMENAEGDSFYVDFTNSNGRHEKQKEKQKLHTTSSKNISDLAQTSEGGSSSNLLESDLSFTSDACNGANGVFTESSNEVNADQTHLKMHLNSFQQLPPLESVGRSHSYSFSGLEDGATNLHTNGTPSNAMSKLIESSPSFAYPSPQSPPQYKEDILHRRLFLEEEFLQISGDFHCASSFGSGSSCSDDSSGDLCSCNSEGDCIAIQTKMELALNGEMASVPCVDSDHEEKGEMEQISGEKTLSDCSAEDDPTCTDAIEFGIKELHDRNQRNGHLGQDSGHLVRQKGKQKFKRRILPIFKNFNGTKLEFLKANGDEVDEGVSVGENGHLRYNLRKGTLCKDQSSEKHNSSILHKNNLSTSADTVSHSTDRYKLIEDFFNVEVANNEEFEICEQGARCGYMFQDGSDLVHREVALLRSSQNKLYVLLVDMAQDGQETVPTVLGSYRLEDLEKVLIGLGLQALRVHMADNITHLFLTRTPKEAQDVLWLLNLSSFPQLTSGVSLESWENVQVKLLEKYICASLKMGIFLYSMLMFWKNDAEEESLVFRSLIVTEGSIFVCIEDLHQFGCLADDSNPPYFSLDECCSINNIQELVVDHRDKKCLTLVLDKHIHEGRFRSSIRNSQNKQSDEIYTIRTWKLKWFSEETRAKFISVLKALHSAAAASSLPVKCLS